MKKTCIIIAGPTAVGKTAVSIEIASLLGTSIVSADSRQCYRELGIGVAKPSPSELGKVKHYFINSHSIHDPVNAADFERYALTAAAEIFSQSDFMVMTGGTGLYIRAFTEGLDSIPEVPVTIRDEVVSGYETHGLPWLEAMLQEKDSHYVSSGEMRNPQRMMRALEVVLHTGHSIMSFREKKKAVRDFDIITVVLDLPREKLYDNINRRVDQMMLQGLESEVFSLRPFRHLNALQTVGYAELFDHFDGNTSKERAVELIKQNTRHYAKRQLTWFRKEKETVCLPPYTGKVMDFIESRTK